MKTDATASPPLTFSRARLYARTASPPTLAGRNVPANVLTKKMRITAASGGRAAGSIDAEQYHPPIGHQDAIGADQGGGDGHWPQVAPAAAATTARG